MPFDRTTIQDFSTANKIYANATVTFYKVDDVTGQKTSAKADIFADIVGDTKLKNPQTLDSYGKFKVPAYIQDPVIATVSGLGNAPAHDTGVISGFQYGNDAQEFAAQAQASAIAAAMAAIAAQGMITVEVPSVGINAATYYGRCVLTTSNTSVTVNLPSNAPVGTMVGFIQCGTGQLTFNTSVNPLEHRQGYYKTVGKWSGCLCHCIRTIGGASEWWIDGDLTA